MTKNQKLTRENLLDSTPENSESESDIAPTKKAVAAKPQHKAPEPVAKAKVAKKEEKKAPKEVPRKESSHSNKDESHKAPVAPKHSEGKKDKASKKEEAPRKEEAPKKVKETKQKEEEPKLGKRDAPSKSVVPAKVAPKKDTKVKEISDDSSDESDDEPVVKKVAKKEEKAPKKEQKAAPVAVSKKSESSATNSKKASFHEAEATHQDKNKKVKPSVAVPAKKEADSKLNKMKQALKKPETEESEEESEEEVQEDSEEEMEVEESEESEEEAPKPRKASVEKAAPRKASAEKVVAPRKASAEKVNTQANGNQFAQGNQGFQNRPNFAQGNQGNQGNNRFGPQYEVIVCGLPFVAGENEIRSHFGSINDITSVKVMMGQDGRPRGKAFLKFGSENSMNTALELNGSNLGGRNIIVELTDNMKGAQGGQNRNQGGFQGGNQGGFQGGFQGGNQRGPQDHAPESTNVMVKNLAFSVDETKLQSVFSGCGPIKGVRVCKKEDGSSRGFGFVDFTSIESAKNALKKSNEKIDGRNIEVFFSLPRDKSAPRPGGSFGGRPGGNFGGRPGGNFGAERKGNLTQFQGEAVDLD